MSRWFNPVETGYAAASDHEAEHFLVENFIQRQKSTP